MPHAAARPAYLEAIQILRGSSNQSVIFMTDRYKGYRDLFNKKGRDVEIYATPKNVVMVGVPTKTTLQEWHKIIAKGESSV